jgi:hypothetical protein
MPLSSIPLTKVDPKTFRYKLTAFGSTEDIAVGQDKILHKLNQIIEIVNQQQILIKDLKKTIEDKL